MSILTTLPTLSVAELKRRLDQGDAITLIDVREDIEVATGTLPGAVHIRLSDIPLRLGEIPTDKPIVVYCHHGRRSDQAGRYLQAKGVTDVTNLTGGIHAWATEIDPSLPVY